MTTHKLQDLLPRAIDALQERYQGNPEEILRAWPKAVGTAACMTQAVRFVNGVLHVTVQNSTLLSLLARPQDKQRLINALQQLVPHVIIRNIVFRIG